jgi:hypothetical protein
MDFPGLGSLIAGVFGGLIPLSFKYLVDRFAESHRAEVSVAAKRKERLYDKQAAVIAVAYERLARWSEAARCISLPEFDVEAGVLSDWGTERLKEKVERADQAADAFREHFIANKIYLPTTLDEEILRITLNLYSATAKPKLLTLSDPTRRDVTDRDREYIKQCLERASTLLAELRERFYKLMLRDEPSKTPVAETANDSASRGRPQAK